MRITNPTILPSGLQILKSGGYEGFQFWKLDNKTKIVISGYMN